MKRLLLISVILLAGCASGSSFIGSSLNPPPEYNQEIILLSSDNYNMHQAPRSGYDVGDLQSFHSQHTFSMKAEDAFKELFGKVKLKKPGEPGIDTGVGTAAAVFEVNIIDLAHDNFVEADRYRAEATIAAAMRSPDGKVFWQEAFRGRGRAEVFDEYSVGLGPEEAVVYAVDDALQQMQQAILKNSQIRIYFQKYAGIESAKSETEQSL